MMSLITLLVLLAAVVGLGVVQLAHFAWLMRWSDRQTNGLNYYGLSAVQREQFQRRLRGHAHILAPIRWLLSRCGKFKFGSGTFCYRGVPGPKAGSCSEQTFRQAERYQPTQDDVFVVTQMRSGTTWMQHLVFQVLSRGTRDLAAEDTCLNAISPWLESHKSVTVDAAPKIGVGDSAKRIIKTHLPVALCPFSERAKYIYVVRHPVSCFASCVDFVRSNLRGFEPSRTDCLEWFLSNKLMWWGTWWDHVAGWHQRVSTSDNVLFVRFEDMKADLSAVIERVADFLEVEELTAAELETIAERCSFDYMRQNSDVFEMHPPHVLQIPGRFFVSGRTERNTRLPMEYRDRIRDACQDSQAACDLLPLETLYPDLLLSSPESTVASEISEVLVGS